MIIRELTKELSLAKILLFATVLGLTLMLTASVAFAFHPGQNRSGDVPQGPHQTACGNQGRDGNGQGRGIDHAIASGGMVHCEPEPHCFELAAGIFCEVGPDEFDPDQGCIVFGGLLLCPAD